MNKVVLITESLGAGGAERQLVGLAVMLKHAGYNVYVLTYFNKNFYKDYLDKEGIQNELYEKACNRYLRVFRLCKRINDINPDITISFLPGSNVALGIGKFFNILKCKLIVSERNYTWNWNLKTLLYFKTYQKVDWLVANSFAEADNIKKHNPFLSHNTSAIQNFVDTDTFIPKKYPKNKEIRVLTVARIIEYKNVHGLIEVAKKLRNDGYIIHWDWYGYNYYDAYYAKVQKLINTYNIEDIFSIHKPVKNINEIYPKYDVFCLPSFTEGYPNVIVEAMSCQLPILCSNICDNPLIVEDGVNGYLFNPYDIEDMVTAFKKILSMKPSILKEIGVRNRNKVLNNNSCVVFASRYIGLINQLLK